MANIILPKVNIISEINENTNVLVEHNNSIQRFNINNINAEIKNTVENLAEESTLIFTDWTLSELQTNGNIKKKYVLNDGYIYSYELLSSENVPLYTNLVNFSTIAPDSTEIYNGVGYKDGYRWSSSGKTETATGEGRITGWIPFKSNATLRIENFGLSRNTGYVMGAYIVYRTNTNSYTTVQTGFQSTDSYTMTFPNNSNYTHFRISGYGINVIPSLKPPIVTIDEEIKNGSINEYSWVKKDYIGKNNSSDNIMYIAPDGNDNNDGLTSGTPKLTVAACVKAGATKISAKRGIYSERPNCEYLTSLEIFPTDNDITYTDGLERSPIIFEDVDKFTSTDLILYNSIYKITYPNDERMSNTQIDKVFISKSLTPLYSTTDYGSRYNSTVWLFNNDKTDIKLKPVLTLAECEAENNTFTYINEEIYINADITNVESIVIPRNWNSGMRFYKCQNIILKEVESRFSGSYAIDLRDCAYFELYKCACKYTTYGSGFHPINSNGIMTSCYAAKNFDGYGISGYGHTTYIDCVSEFNFDDGMSHHDATTGTVIGGRYEGNGKGGNTPAYGAKVNIYGGLYKNNKSFGIGYLYASSSGHADGMVEGAILVDNPVGLVVNANCNVTASSCIYKNNAADKEINGNFTEYNGNYVNDNDNNSNENPEAPIKNNNLIPQSVNADDTPYIGSNGEKGYNQGWRVSSSGVEKQQTGYACTGWIPAIAGDIIRIANCTIPSLSNDSNSLATIYIFNENDRGGKPARTIYLTKDANIGNFWENGIYTNTISGTVGSPVWLRVTLIGMTDETIITLNEEIVQEQPEENPPADDNNNIQSHYTNLLTTSTAEDRITPYNNGKGYKMGRRLSASNKGAETSGQENSGVTGFIEAKVNDVIRIQGSAPLTGQTSYLMTYDSNNTLIGYQSLYQPNNGWSSNEFMTYDSTNDIITIPLTKDYFGTGFNAFRLSIGFMTDNTVITKNQSILKEDSASNETYEQSLLRIKNWKYPIFEDAPVFLLKENKPAIAKEEQNTAAVYAKYDALMAQYPWFITKEDLGLASDNETPLYAYHFKEPTPHYPSGTWSETKPVILICSGVHPTEQTGIHCMYHALEEITTNDELLDLRRNLHFIVMPVINPTGWFDSEWGVRNPDGIQVHYNFEVDFKYPEDAGYVEHGNRNHGGETPLSIPETIAFDNLMQEHKEHLACVLSCHNNDVDTRRGTDYVWCSCATHFMCNIGFRLADKMSAAWRKKYGTQFDEGLVWANEYALQKAAAGSSIFNSEYVLARDPWDYRVGMASLSGSGGTEYKQALKYGVHGINVETCDRCLVLDRDWAKTRTENVVTVGTETYINFFRTYMAAYDPKNKKDYAPNLPQQK